MSTSPAPTPRAGSGVSAAAASRGGSGQRSDDAGLAALRSFAVCAADLYAPTLAPLVAAACAPPRNGDADAEKQSATADGSAAGTAASTWSFTDRRWPLLLSLLLHECGLVPRAAKPAAAESRALVVLERVASLVYFTHSWRFHDFTASIAAGGGGSLEELFNRAVAAQGEGNDESNRPFLVDVVGEAVDACFSHVPPDKNNTVLKCAVALMCCLEARGRAVEETGNTSNNAAAAPVRNSIAPLVSCVVALGSGEASFDAARLSLMHVGTRLAAAAGTTATTRTTAAGTTTTKARVQQQIVEDMFIALVDEALWSLDEAQNGNTSLLITASPALSAAAVPAAAAPMSPATTVAPAAPSLSATSPAVPSAFAPLPFDSAESRSKKRALLLTDPAARSHRACNIALQCLNSILCHYQRPSSNANAAATAATASRITQSHSRFFVLLLRSVPIAALSDSALAAFRSVLVAQDGAWRGRGDWPRNISVFIFGALLPLVKSRSAPLPQRAAVLGCLLEAVADQPQVLLDFFLNYDCREHQKSVFQEFVREVASLAVDGASPTATAGATASSSSDSGSVPRALRQTALTTLVAVLASVRLLLRRFITNDGGVETEKTRPIGRNDSDDDAPRSAGTDDTSATTAPATQTQAAPPAPAGAAAAAAAGSDLIRNTSFVGLAVQRKHASRDAAAKFNAKQFEAAWDLIGAKISHPAPATASDAVPPPAETKHTAGEDHAAAQPPPAAHDAPAFDADAIARFLYRDNAQINKMVLGEFLSKKHSLHRAVLSAFIQQHNFEGLAVDEALRMFLGSFKLLGEAQVVDATMEHFAAHYMAQNPDVAQNGGVPTAGAAFVLAFSICLLNTDAHSPNVADAERMRLDTFVMRVRSLDDGAELPDALLRGIYERVVANEISLRMGPNDTFDDSNNAVMGAKNQKRSTSNSGVLSGLARAVMLPLELTGIAKLVEARRNEREFSQESKRVISAALNELQFASRVAETTSSSLPSLTTAMSWSADAGGVGDDAGYITGDDLAQVLPMVDVLADLNLLESIFLPIVLCGAAVAPAATPTTPATATDAAFKPIVNSEQHVLAAHQNVSDADFDSALRGAFCALRCFVLSTHQPQRQQLVESAFRRAALLAAPPATATTVVPASVASASAIDELFGIFFHGHSSHLVVSRRMKVLRAVLDCLRGDIETGCISGFWPDAFRLVGVLSEADLFGALTSVAPEMTEEDDEAVDLRLRNPLVAATATANHAAAASSSASGFKLPSFGRRDNAGEAAVTAAAAAVAPSAAATAASAERRDAVKSALLRDVFFDRISEDVFGRGALFVDVSNSNDDRQRIADSKPSEPAAAHQDHTRSVSTGSPMRPQQQQQGVSLHVLHAQIDALISVCRQEALGEIGQRKSSGGGSGGSATAQDVRPAQAPQHGGLRPVFTVALLPLLTELLARFSTRATRIVWESVWSTASSLLVQIGCCSSSSAAASATAQRNGNSSSTAINAAVAVSLCAVEQLTEIVASFLQRTAEELAHFTFQRNCMQPFIAIMLRNADSRARVAVVRGLKRVAMRSGRRLASGWEVVLNGLGHAAMFGGDVSAEAWPAAKELVCIGRRALLQSGGDDASSQQQQLGSLLLTQDEDEAVAAAKHSASTTSCDSGTDEDVAGSPGQQHRHQRHGPQKLGADAMGSATMMARLRVQCISAFAACPVPDIALEAVLFTDAFVRGAPVARSVADFLQQTVAAATATAAAGTAAMAAVQPVVAAEGSDAPESPRRAASRRRRARRPSPVVWAKILSACSAFLSVVLSPMSPLHVRLAALASATSLLLCSDPGALATESNGIVRDWRSLVFSGFSLPLLSSRSLTYSPLEQPDGASNNALRVAAIASVTALLPLFDGAASQQQQQLADQTAQMIEASFDGDGGAAEQSADPHSLKWPVLLLWLTALRALRGGEQTREPDAAHILPWAKQSVRDLFVASATSGQARDKNKQKADERDAFVVTALDTVLQLAESSSNREQTSRGVSACRIAMMLLAQAQARSADIAVPDAGGDDSADASKKRRAEDTALQLVIAAVTIARHIAVSEQQQQTQLPRNAETIAALVTSIFSVWDSWRLRALRSRSAAEVRVAASIGHQLLACSTAASAINIDTDDGHHHHQLRFPLALLRWASELLTAHKDRDGVTAGSHSKNAACCADIAEKVLVKVQQQRNQHAGGAAAPALPSDVTVMCLAFVKALPHITLACQAEDAVATAERLADALGDVLGA